MNIRCFAVISGVLFSALVQVSGVAQPKLIPRAELASGTYSTWEGSYVFTEEEVLRIEGLPDLHVLVYQHPGRERKNLIDFAEVAFDDMLQLLGEARTDVKGVTPALEGIDVLPGTNEAEIIVRWRHPGNGGLRSVEKYCYTPHKLEFVAGSDFVSDGRKMKWVKGGSSAPSTPARYSPRKVMPPAK